MSKDIDPPAGKRQPHRWQPGESGNPAGRPKGSRNALRDEFYRDVLADWREHGRKAIETFRTERPHDYVKCVASVLPREVKVEISELEELSDAEISAQLTALVREMRAAGLDPFAGDEEPLGPQRARPIPPVH